MPPTESVIPNALRLRLQQILYLPDCCGFCLHIFLYPVIAQAIARSKGLLPEGPDCVAAVANPYADSENWSLRRTLSAAESLFKVMPFRNNVGYV